MNQTEIAQPAIFAVQVAIAALLQSWGVEPSAVIGHSVGEVAAAHVAGVLDLESAVRVVYHRARLMQGATGLGRMAAVGLSPAAAQEVIAAHPGVSLAAINGPRSVTLSGLPASIEAIVQRLQAEQTFCRVLPVDYAFHSEQMEPFAAALTGALAGLAVHTPKVPLASTVTGALARPGDFDAPYWG